MSQGDDTGDGPVLVAGHESAGGTELAGLAAALPGASLTVAGRPLHDVVQARLAARADVVTVLPMTWGRDPVLVADSARTLSWLRAGAGAGRVALAEPFGAVDHLTSLLRLAVTRATARHPGATVLIAGRRADPFDDAELHRVAHLVRTHGPGTAVEVACVAGPEDLARAVDRARLLGAEQVVVVPAGFGTTVPGATDRQDVHLGGPLLPVAVMAQVAGRRVADARHALQHGDDGIDAGLLADHDHGYAHSHAVEGDEHGHAHPHGHAHGHGHPHTHAPPGEAARGLPDEPVHRHAHDPATTGAAPA